jgi:hypothetical protein
MTYVGFFVGPQRIRGIGGGGPGWFWALLAGFLDLAALGFLLWSAR